MSLSYCSYRLLPDQQLCTRVVHLVLRQLQRCFGKLTPTSRVGTGLIQCQKNMRAGHGYFEHATPPGMYAFTTKLATFTGIELTT